MFVVKKTSVWNDAAKLPSPNFLTMKMGTMQKSTALSATLYCILIERKHFSALAKTLLYLGEHIVRIFSEIRAQYTPLCYLFHKMATLMEFYTTVTTECEFKYLMSVVKQLNEKFNKLTRRVARVQGCKKIANKKIQDLNSVLSEHITDLELVIPTIYMFFLNFFLIISAGQKCLKQKRKSNPPTGTRRERPHSLWYQLPSKND